MGQRDDLRREIDRAELELVARVQELEVRAEDLKQRVVDTLNLTHQVQRHPWRAVGTAMVAGIFIGWLVS